MTRPSSLFVTAALAALPSCHQFQVDARAGYAEFALSGDMALDSTGTGLFEQDSESALGLGEDQGAPYGRIDMDLGVPLLSVSAFGFDEQGQGTLQADFGEVVAGQDVNSDFSMVNVKGQLGFQIDLGAVAITPGVAVDWFDIDLFVEDTAGIASERVELQAPVPMVFLRGDADLGVVGLMAEVGYVTVPEVDDVEGTMWDAEAMVEVRPTDSLFLFGGYRAILIDAEGMDDGDEFDVDLQIDGWMLGGGVRF